MVFEIPTSLLYCNLEKEIVKVTLIIYPIKMLPIVSNNSTKLNYTNTDADLKFTIKSISDEGMVSIKFSKAMLEIAPS